MTAPELTAEEAAVVARFEAAEPAPESFRPLPGEVEMHRAMNATEAQRQALRRVAGDVGRCGMRAPTVVNGPTIHCALPARHLGWHRSDDSAEWGPADGRAHDPATEDEYRPEAAPTHVSQAWLDKVASYRSNEHDPATEQGGDVTEADREKAHRIWNEALCNSGVPGWDRLNALASALAAERSARETAEAKVRAVEALADTLDSLAYDRDVQRLTAPNAYRSAARHIRAALGQP